MNQLIQVIAGSFLLFSCSELTPLDSGENEGNLNVEELTLEETAKEINAVVALATATGESYCSTIAIGAKPCGGPWGYLVYSAEDLDEEYLKELVNHYNELDHLRNMKEGRMSTCDVASKPELTYTNARCRGEGRNAWNPGDILKFNGLD
ncbi:MAG: hypothetical protein JJU46_06735 [Balneolaceae bacterium]|nr:hypothetical protein [Balneolaceae bacterium]